MEKIKAVLKVFLFLLWCCICVPAQMVYLLFSKGPGAYLIPYIWQCGVCKIFSIKVVVEGASIIDKQAVFCSNHLSYLDIPVIGSVLKASFVAKSEVETWPVFGFLSKLQQTVFISRKRSDTHKAAQQISDHLAEGKSIILFPEGTSGDGQDILPIKASMFSPLMELDHVAVQPFTITMKELNKSVPSNQEDRDLYTWYGDMDLAPHLWSFAQKKGAVIALVFHDPMDVADFSDRKALAQECERKIRMPLDSAEKN